MIDSKGVNGEPAFIHNSLSELLNHSDASNIIHNRFNHVAKLLELLECRILDWCFVQAGLAWVWALEDGCDASYFEQLTKVFDKIS